VVYLVVCGNRANHPSIIVNDSPAYSVNSENAADLHTIGYRYLSVRRTVVVQVCFSQIHNRIAIIQQRGTLKGSSPTSSRSHRLRSCSAPLSCLLCSINSGESHSSRTQAFIHSFAVESSATSTYVLTLAPKLLFC